jgi:phage recombination protein Bet
MTALVKTEKESNIVEMVRVLFPHLQNVNDVEIKKAIGLAKHLGLDPTKKEVHFIPFKGSLQLVVSYTEYIKRAERTGRLDGWNVEIGKDAVDTFAEVVIYRKDWSHPLKWKVYLSEAKKDTQNWKSMPLFMLKKTAISQSFRLAFPEETASLPYEEAEFASEPTIINETVKELPKELPKETSTEDKEDKISEAQKKRLWAIANDTAKKHGLTKEVVETVIKSVLSEYGIESTRDISKDNYEEIIERIIKELEEISSEGGF